MNKYLKVYANKRMLTTFLLGFSGGLPLALTAGGSTVQGWLSDAKVDLTSIGYFGLIGLPYATKFLWAPFIDSVSPPLLSLRRGWMVISQICLIASLLLMAHMDPATRLDLFALVGFLVAFFSASQDIVIDAYRTEILEKKEEVGAGAAAYVSGYRIATVVSGGAALAMSAHMPWTQVYYIMAVLSTLGVITILLSPEPKISRGKKKFDFEEMVASPFAEFFRRQGGMEILLFIMVYKLSTLMSTALMTKFLLTLGYEKDMVGYTNKVFGLIATIGGTVAGGALMVKFGLKRSLWIFGAIQSLVGLSFVVLPHVNSVVPEFKNVSLIAMVCIDNLMMGMGTAALTGFMMSFVNKKFTGTQLALLTSVMAVSRVILIGPAGSIVEAIGWDMFFFMTVPLAIPGLLLLSHFDTWQIEATDSKRLSWFMKLNIAVFMGALLALITPPVWNWQQMPDAAHWAEKIGAFGILFVVIVGVIRPHVAGKSRRRKALA